jgi:Family of unknown function (DUF6010)
VSTLLSRWREGLVGVLLGAATYGVARAFPASWQLGIEGALVAWIGAIYVGFGLASGTRPALIEATGGVVMLVFAVFGAASAPWLLTAALVLHAGWDLAHHEGRISRAVPRWYPSFCAAADLVLAGLFGATRATP